MQQPQGNINWIKAVAAVVLFFEVRKHLLNTHSGRWWYTSYPHNQKLVAYPHSGMQVFSRNFCRSVCRWRLLSNI